jgi:hypothetical protein
MFRIIARLIGTALLLALGAGLAGPAQAQTGEVPMVYPQTGAPGTRFGFIASGYSSRERVGVWLNTPDGRVIDTGIENLERATRQGRVSWNWTAPKDAPTGTYKFVAHGVSSGFEQTIAFEVQAVAPPAKGINIEPQQPRPGNLLTFYASGFLLDEDVRIWANAADGTIVTVDPSYRNLYNGRLDASWILPDAAQTGWWSIVITGVDSGIQQVIPFEVVARR